MAVRVIGAAAAAAVVSGCDGGALLDGQQLPGAEGATSPAGIPPAAAAGDHRRGELAQVEDGFMPVPGRGRLHRSCIHEIPSGATVDGERNVYLDGVLVARHQPCAYPAKGVAVDQPSLPAAGQGTAPPATPGPVGTGWIEAIFAWAIGPRYWYNRLTASWLVPADPPAQESQLLYYFPALTSPFGRGGILQPVLQWGVSPAGGGKYWAIASWWVWADNSAYYTPLIRVWPNDRIYGDMWASACSATGICEWRVLVRNERTGEFRNAGFFDPSAIYKVAYAGALEAYGVSKCDHYPGGRNGVTRFQYINAYEPSATDVNMFVYMTHQLPWTARYFNASPDCGFDASWDGSQVVLKY